MMSVGPGLDRAAAADPTHGRRIRLRFRLTATVTGPRNRHRRPGPWAVSGIRGGGVDARGAVRLVHDRSQGPGQRQD